MSSITRPASYTAVLLPRSQPKRRESREQARSAGGRLSPSYIFPADFPGSKKAPLFSYVSQGPPRSADPCALGLSSALDHSFEVRLHPASTRLQHIHSRSYRPPIVVGCVQLIFIYRCTPPVPVVAFADSQVFAPLLCAGFVDQTA